ncbi:MAG: hypothetical protein R2747_15340 [Pyrinomonadaceae bacterium]
MPFNPNRLPPTVHDVYKKGPSLWVLTVKTAIEVGITNTNILTDIAFYQHNPDLEGRALEVGETDLIAQWKYFQRLIRGMLKSYAGTTGSHFYSPPFSGGSTILEPLEATKDLDR